MDRKACDAVTGLGGAYCDLCLFSKDDAHNPVFVASMKVERTLESTLEICQRIPANQDGELKTAMVMMIPEKE